MNILTFPRFINLALLVLTLFSLCRVGEAQGFDRIEKERLKGILGIVKNEVKRITTIPRTMGSISTLVSKKADERLGSGHLDQPRALGHRTGADRF